MSDPLDVTGRERELLREYSPEEKRERLLRQVELKQRIKAQQLAQLQSLTGETARFAEALNEPIFTLHEMEAVQHPDRPPTTPSQEPTP